MAELWLYLDATTGQQKGPVPAPIVKKLLRKGILQPKQLVWTQRLSEWSAIASVEPFAAYCRVWAAVWFYMAENQADSSAESTSTGPVTTQQLVTLFVDGQVDGMTLVWSQELDGWKPIGEVPSLKEFLQEANDDLDREQELQEQTSEMPVELQVFEKESADALVAEDGKRYVFDAESKTYVTPEDKIEDELASLQQAMVEADAKKERVDQPRGKENNMEAAAEVAEAEAAKMRKKKKKKNKNKWKKSKSNTWVYVNGLPLDITVQEVHDHFAKCGVIQSDIGTGEPRIKLYENKESSGLNGDGTVCYMKEASVELAVQLLDKSQIRPEWPIDVSPAEFKQKGQDFVKRKKPKIDTRAKIKLFEKAKALSWNEGEVSEPAGLRIVVIKHMFTPAEIEDEEYEKELQEDIHNECSKIGEVSKITLFAKHVDGVVAIKFASSGSAANTTEEKERADKFQEWLEEGSSSSDSEGEEEAKE
uniref:RRM domain-containing protein n=1 Tax=Phytophthora ramorum TaxID=164328 RepID=H3HCJ4_PHYRM